MSIRNRLFALTAVLATLAIAAPVAGASAATTSTTSLGPSSIPCYPYPAFCGPTGKPWFPFMGWFFTLPGMTNPFG